MVGSLVRSLVRWWKNTSPSERPINRAIHGSLVRCWAICRRNLLYKNGTADRDGRQSAADGFWCCQRWSLMLSAMVSDIVSDGLWYCQRWSLSMSLMVSEPVRVYQGGTIRRRKAFSAVWHKVFDDLFCQFAKNAYFCSGKRPKYGDEYHFPEKKTWEYYIKTQ